MGKERSPGDLMTNLVLRAVVARIIGLNEAAAVVDQVVSSVLTGLDEDGFSGAVLWHELGELETYSESRRGVPFSALQPLDQECELAALEDGIAVSPGSQTGPAWFERLVELVMEFKYGRYHVGDPVPEEWRRLGFPG